MIDSPYYPPRATWFSPLRRWALAVRKIRAVDRLMTAEEVTLGGLVAAFLIPGLGIMLGGRGELGQAAMGVCALCVVVFVATVGYAVATVAFTLVLAIHAVGFLYYARPALEGAEWPNRVVVAVGASGALLGAIYLPLRDYSETHWFMPVQRGHQVVVIHARPNPGSVKPGDWGGVSLRGRRARRGASERGGEFCAGSGQGRGQRDIYGRRITW